MSSPDQFIKDEIKKIKLLSPNTSRLLMLNANPEHSLQEVIDLVKLDSTLTARTLSIVNSAAYNPLMPINSIDRAISFLGEKMVVSIAISESAGKLLNQPLKGYDSNASELWKHDLFCAFAAREVARHAKTEMEVELAFTAGLLHDIGKPVLSKLLQQTSENTLKAVDDGDAKNYLEAEKKVSGAVHTEVGYLVAQHWQLPEPIIAAIRYHHDPATAKEEFKPLAYAVHLGDIIAMMSGYATGCDSLQYNLDSRYETYFNISATELTKIISDAESAFQPALEALGGEGE